MSCVSLAVAGLATAQTIAAAITGAASDPTGSVIPNGTVTATNIETNVKTTTMTNADGIYTFPFLRVGSYTITIESKGFKKSVAGPFTVEANQMARIDIKLELGDTTQVVEVVGVGPLPQTETQATSPGAMTTAARFQGSGSQLNGNREKTRVKDGLSKRSIDFSGAEGFGAVAKGGRGGDVYRVTNLSDSGPGSLRFGVQSATGPRTIIFDVSGTIFLKSTLPINKPFLTLAGQTAPGDGVTIAGFTTLVSNTHDVIVRYMRFRPGDIGCPAMQGDSLSVDKSTDVLIDHVSASWSIDEALSVTGSDRVTVQWSIIGESLNQSCHEKGEHGYGSLIRYGAGNVTFHHNLYVHNHSRNPRVGDGILLDFVNNVIYNYGAHGGEATYSGPADEGVTKVNYIGNYTIAGPSTDASRRARTFLGGSTNTHIYQSGNLIDGNLNVLRDGTDTGWGMFGGQYSREAARFDAATVTTTDATAAYRKVLDSAGASLVRDSVDKRLIAEVQSDTGRVVNSQEEVGGFPTLASKPAPIDSDGDGIPDAWETAHGLNPQDASDGPANLERYLQDIITPAAADPTVILDDQFEDGDSQNQDLDANSVWLFNGRTNNIRTDASGSLTIDMRPAGSSSEAVWAFFTKAGSPVRLGVGDKITVAVTFSVQGFTNNGQDIRFGVLDSQGTRNAANLAGGHNDATFIGDTGYGVDFFASGTGSPFVLGRRAALGNANMFNNFGDFSSISGEGSIERQALLNDMLYTLEYGIERISDTRTRLTVAVRRAGTNISGVSYTAIENSPEPNTTFDSFAFRVGGTNFATHLQFTRLFVQYRPAAPSITSQPRPSSLTVQTGATVTMAIAAEGSNLTYQWHKDGGLLANNPSAATPVLTLEKVTLSDAGIYNAYVSNAGGLVISDSVPLRVSSTPVAPLPAITRQPVSRTVVLGESTALSVQASGSELVHQWFKDRALIPGATAAALTFAQTRASDSGTYYVVISNSSGSVYSDTANLLVVSPMTATSVTPWPGRSGLCVDATLAIDFDRKPKLGKTGRIRIVDASTGTAVDTIDMAANPQSRVNGGTSFNYYPVLIDGNRVSIYLHKTLPLGGKYSVLIEPGVVLDDSGAPWIGIADPGEWTFSTKSDGPAADADLINVAPDSFQDFCTVQAAIDAVPSANAKPVTILVQPGVYNEIVYVPSNKPYITVQGADRASTVIQYPNNANLNQGNSRAMFGVDAPDFTLENITLWNTTPKGGSQAEAFRGNNQRILLDHVTLKSFQDTLLLQGRGMVNDSYIEGDVDFMWGAGTVFVQDSELRAVSSGGYYTQIRNVENQKGYVFVRSRLTAPEGVSGVYLARIDPTVFPFSQAVYIDCVMGSHVIPAGWLLNNAASAPRVQFWEFNSRDLAGAATDVSQRALFSRQLAAAEAETWSNPSFVLDGWVPTTLSATRLFSGVKVRWTTSKAASTVELYRCGSEGPVASRTAKGHSGEMEFQVPQDGARYEVRMGTKRLPIPTGKTF